MADETNPERGAKQGLHIELPRRLVERVDTYRFGTRKRSRTAAIIALLQKALKEEGR